MSAPAENDSAQVSALVAAYADPGAMIAGLSTRMEVREVAGLHMPVSVNERRVRGNCYLVSPTTALIDYALEETRNFATHPALRAVTRGLIRAAAPLVRASGLDAQAQANNWLFSTCPVPPMDRAAVAALRDALRAPGRAVVIRSLNDAADGATMAALRAEGFRLLPARQVWLFDGLSAPTRDERQDARLLARTPHSVIGAAEIAKVDYDRMAELYEALYIRKYTPLNPRYTPRAIRDLHRSGILRLTGLRGEDGQLVAFGGQFVAGGVLTQPLLGYDTGRPQREGLYRMITALAMAEARARGLTFNMSAGAAGFKRLRGARPAIEYTAVFAADLPAPRRAALHVIEGLLAGVGVPLLRRFQL